MELSFVSSPKLKNAPGDGPRGPGRPSEMRPELVNVPVPRELRQFGRRVRASALGDPSLPAAVVLGGISADCFPALRPDGSPGWWADLAGHRRSLDPEDFYVVGVDFAADDSGALAPSTSDQARILAEALDCLGIDRPATIVGASYGAMVGLALAEADPERVDRLVVISAGAQPHPQSTAARELQRRVVSLGIQCGRGEEAMAIARGMAMLTYRSPAEFDERFVGGIEECAASSCSEPGRYLRARGEAFRSVMSPGHFLSLSASIDRHRVRPEAINVPSLVIGALSDQLVFPDDLRRLAKGLAGDCELHLLDSLYGHDMFLKEAERLGEIVAPFLAKSR